VQPGQLAGPEVPEDLELQGGAAGPFATATTLEEGGQPVGQGDGGGVTDEDGGEPPEQGGGRRLGGDGLLFAIDDTSSKRDGWAFKTNLGLAVELVNWLLVWLDTLNPLHKSERRKMQYEPYDSRHRETPSIAL
jgi:hypothetical protein